MSQENVEVVRRIYDAVARGDSETVLSLYDPDIEWDMSRGAFGDIGGGRVYRGHDGLRSFFREQWEAWDRWQDHPEELIDADTHVVSVVRSRARGRTSEAEVESVHAAVWTLRQEKVVRVDWLPTREEALEAVGLRE
jgi:ketosteroid isomerase-like protein